MKWGRRGCAVKFLLFSAIPSAVLKHTVKQKFQKTFSEEIKIGADVALYFGSVELGKRRLREHCIKLGAFEVPFCLKGGKRRVRKYCYRLVAVLRDKPSKDSPSHIRHSCVPRK